MLHSLVPAFAQAQMDGGYGLASGAGMKPVSREGDDEPVSSVRARIGGSCQVILTSSSWTRTWTKTATFGERSSVIQ